MSWDLNQVTLIGRLTKNPELRYSQNGNAICPLSLAVNRAAFKDGVEDEVYFFDVVTFGKTAEICNQYLTKGKQVGIQGYLRQRRWDDPNGQKRYKIEIVADRIQFLGSPGGTANVAGQQSKSANAVDPSATAIPASEFDEAFPDDDEIPF